VEIDDEFWEARGDRAAKLIAGALRRGEIEATAHPHHGQATASPFNRELHLPSERSRLAHSAGLIFDFAMSRWTERRICR
jgi:hypothetical protein